MQVLTIQYGDDDELIYFDWLSHFSLADDNLLLGLGQSSALMQVLTSQVRDGDEIDVVS